MAALAAAHASGLPVVAPVAPIAYDYGTSIVDAGSIQQNRVTGYAGLGYGLAYSGLAGYRGFGPYYSNFGGLYGGLGYGGYFPGYGLGGYFLGKR